MRRSITTFTTLLFLLVFAQRGLADTVTVCASGCNFTSINDAIDAVSDGDVIQLFDETYYEGSVISTNGKAITVRGEVDFQGVPTTILDGQGVRQVLNCNDSEDETTIFENLLITNGRASSGGGMMLYGCSPTLINCTFTNNWATSRGGGLFADNSSTTIDTCSFTSNTAQNQGGGIYIYGSGASLTLTDTNVCANTSSHHYGSQIYGSSWNDGSGNFISGDCDGVITVCPTGCDRSDIEEALTVSVDGDLIEIAAGTYLLDSTLSTNGKAITVRGEVDLQGVPTTILDGQGVRQILYCNDSEDETTIFENLLITNGRASSGGGMALYGCSPTLINCTFTNNWATSRGGGLFADNSSTTIDTCSFTSNTAQNEGGGIYIYGSGASLTLTDTNVCANTSSHHYGSQIYGSSWIDGSGNFISGDCDGVITVCPTGCDRSDIEEALTVSVDGDLIEIAAGTYLLDSTLSTNGKAITVRGEVDLQGVPTTILDGQEVRQILYCNDSEDETTIFENLLIINGHASSGGGMALYGCSPTLINCTFTNNWATSRGGGLFADNSSTTIDTCSFTSNTAQNEGGGIYIYGSGASLTLTDTNVCANTSSHHYGSQIYGSSWIDGSGNFISGDCDGVITVCPTGCDRSDIEEALTVSVDGDLIEIAAGTYLLDSTLSTNGKAITVRGEVDLQGVPTTILDGQEVRQILYCNDSEDETTIFENLLIINGHASSGGGMALYGCSPTLINCTFTNNWATSRGGGLFADNSSTTIDTCSFTSNTAQNQGGGIYIYGSGASLTLTDTNVCANTSSHHYGSQIYGSSWNDGSGNFISGDCDGVITVCPTGCDRSDIEEALTVSVDGDLIEIAAGTYLLDSTLSTNGKAITVRGEVDLQGVPTTILDGQGVRQILYCNDSEDETTIFENLLITNGRASSGGGMALYGCSPTLINCTFTNNWATSRGGGLFADNSSTTIDTCSFTSNTAQNEGGGIYIYGSSNSMTLTDTTVCGNTPDQINGAWHDNGGNTVAQECPLNCPADLDGDGVVSGSDLAFVLGAWGINDSPADFDGDGDVDGADLAVVLGAWGSCPE